MWLWLVAAVVAAIIIFKFVVKPLFKLIAIVALVALVWWLVGGSLPWHL